RRSALVIPPYLVTVLIWGAWSETRLLTPLFPIVLPLALSYLFGVAEGPQPFTRRWVQAAVLVTAIAVNAYHYSFLVPTAALRQAMHGAVVSRTAPAPERYHVLVPYALNPVIDAASRAMKPEKAFVRVYAVYYLLALWLLVAMQFIYFRRWFSDEAAMVGALL